MPVNHQNSNLKDKSFCNEENLKIYLSRKSDFTLEDQVLLKYYIDNYSDCWQMWNRVRWDAAKNSQGVQELKEYLDKDFVPYYDSSWGLAKEWKNKRPHTDKQISDFYKETTNYVYNLVIWAESGDRQDYSKYISELIKKYSLTSVIDFGCGVGTDTITFLKYGIKSYSVDFKCPASDFLNWRLKKRSLKTNFIDVENLKRLPAADMFWAIDVLEHIPDPMSVINMIDLNNCKIFAHCSRFNDDAGGRHPCHINFELSIISDFLISKGFKNVESFNDLSVWVNLNLVNNNA